MTTAEVTTALRKGITLLVHFDDEQQNPGGVVEKIYPTGSVRVRITKPARGYVEGDKLVVRPYDLRRYSWAASLPAE